MEIDYKEMISERALKCARDMVRQRGGPEGCDLFYDSDLGMVRFKFEQGKREKEAKKNQHVVEIKEVRMSPGIDIGDFNTKLRNAQKFIADGNRVKVSVRFRGREMAHTDIGRDLLERFAQQCADTANLDKTPKLEGRMMSIFLSPKAGK